MSSSPRRSTADPSFGNDPISDDQETMQDITITGESPLDHIGDPESPPIPSGPIVLDKSALRRYSGWITLVVASSVAYASLAVEKVSPNAPAAREWSFAVIGITLIVSICVSGCFLAPDCNACTKAFVSPSSSTGRLFELFLVRLVDDFPQCALFRANSFAISAKANLILFLGSFFCSSRCSCSSCGVLDCR